MNILQKLTAILAISAMPFLGTGCADWTPAQSAAATSALVALGAAAVSYASGNIPGAAVDALSAASYGLRTIQGTPNAAAPDAVAKAMTTTAQALSAAGLSAANPKASAVIAKTQSTINTLVSSGATPNQANEAAAKAIDAAVEQVTSAAGPRGPAGKKASHKIYLRFQGVSFGGGFPWMRFMFTQF